MNNYVEVIAIVEGRTEQIFIESILRPYLAEKMIFISATQITKPGQKGGDVRFERIRIDLRNHLRQRSDTYVTTFVDYYGMKEWPDLEKIPPQASPEVIADIMNRAAKENANSLLANDQSERRFIPYIAVHEFEALLFSDADILAREMNIDVGIVNSVTNQFASPEAINNSRETAPSKRLDHWSPTEKFAKTTKGIAIAKEIGISTMREKCPLFNQWLACIEALAKID